MHASRGERIGKGKKNVGSPSVVIVLTKLLFVVDSKIYLNNFILIRVCQMRLIHYLQQIAYIIRYLRNCDVDGLIPKLFILRSSSFHYITH